MVWCVETTPGDIPLVQWSDFSRSKSNLGKTLLLSVQQLFLSGYTHLGNSYVSFQFYVLCVQFSLEMQKKYREPFAEILQKQTNAKVYFPNCETRERLSREILIDTSWKYRWEKMSSVTDRRNVVLRKICADDCIVFRLLLHGLVRHKRSSSLITTDRTVKTPLIFPACLC